MLEHMIIKSEKIIKRTIKAVGQRQSVLLIGDWGEDLTKGIKENQNSLFLENDINKSFSLESNSITRIVADFNSEIFNDSTSFYKEARRLLLPTGMIIISANCEDGLFDKFLNLFGRKNEQVNGIKKIKPKVLQDQIHDNGFLIDGYYGYPGGDLLMMAQIQNKNVTTLFTSEKQETVVN